MTALLLLYLTASSVAASSSSSPSPPSTCRVLSLSGGGSFGAFEAGVLSRMIDDKPGRDYDFILGVSAGALNTGYLSTFASTPVGLKEGAESLKTLWETTRNKNVWKPRLTPLGQDPSLLSTEPLEKLLDHILVNRSVQRRVTIGTTDLATGATARHDEAELSAATNLLLRASSAIPMIFPPVDVHGTRHVDGGNSANVLTIHGIDRCDRDAKQRGDAQPPRVQIDVILASPTIEQIAPAETLDWKLLHLAAREFAIAQKQLFDHQLRFHCPPGVSSRIQMTIRSPKGPIEKGILALLNFDRGAAIWKHGYNSSNVNQTTFDFCM